MRTPARDGLATAALVGALVLPTLLITGGAVAQGLTAGQREATRQLDFARSEFAEGELEASVRSATSALRLDPERVDALVVKALAWEQLGLRHEARVLLSAYVRFVGEDAVDPSTVEALARLQAPEPAVDEPRLLQSRVLERAGDQLVMLFVVESRTPAPVLSWRKPGGDWREAPMQRVDEGRWELRVRMTKVLGGTVECKVGRGSDAARGGGGERGPGRVASSR